MKKKIFIGIGVVIGSVAVVFIFFFFRNVLGDVGYTNKTISDIENLGVKNNSSFYSYNSVRDSLSSIVKGMYVDDLNTKYDRIIKLLNEEEGYISDVYDNTLKLDKYCKGKMYSASSANEICLNYQKYYEQMVNAFVGDVIYINRIIKSYEENHEDSLKEYESLKFNDYVDYNKDGIYAGKEE